MLSKGACFVFDPEVFFKLRQSLMYLGLDRAWRT